MTATSELDTRRTQMPRPWLPTQDQIRRALELRMADAVGADPADPATPVDSPTTTMQQAMGLVIAAALTAGFLPSLWDWWQATRAGTAVPLLDLAEQAARGTLTAFPAPLQPVGDMLQTIAGLEPNMPGWLAALLSALAEWINWPLTWLMYWLVFGIFTLATAKLFGAPTTLQRFYAATGYAAVPLVAVGLSFIPWIGWLFALAGAVLALIAYGRAVRAVTGLSSGESALCVSVPVLLLFILSVVTVAATLASFARIYFM